MRIAAIYDVHGNLPALEAVLEDVRASSIDAIVVGGDVVPGPMPRETLALLRRLDTPLTCLHGNGDREVVAARRGAETPTLPPPALEAIRWCAREISEDDARWLASWPAMVPLDVDGVGRVLFCHASPRNDTDIFTRLTPDEVLLPLFDGVDADLVVCGHTHMQFDRRIGRLRVVNAGSAGMPFGEPGAYWLRLGEGVELRRTAYDLDAAAARIRATPYPQAEQFASAHVLRPPSEAQMLQIFDRR